MTKRKLTPSEKKSLQEALLAALRNADLSGEDVILAALRNADLSGDRDLVAAVIAVLRGAFDQAIEDRLRLGAGCTRGVDSYAAACIEVVAHLAALRNADLSGEDVEAAIIAVLRGADLSSADLSGVMMPDGAIHD
jgi:uncharacterized protein YjbI with pentapeptide repeats